MPSKRTSGRAPQYGRAHQKARRELLADDPACVHCGADGATVADHDPPLALHEHVEESGCCRLVPSCKACSYKQAGQVSTLLRKMGGSATEVVFEEPDPTPGPEHPIWAVEWLTDLLDVPESATWPRFMSAPHPNAIGSYGAEFEQWLADRGSPALYWFQRLAARRLLERNEAGRLVWTAPALFSVARQLGKSHLMRELLLWILHNRDRLFPTGDVLLAARALAVAENLLRPAMDDYQDRPGYKVSRRNGSYGIAIERGPAIAVRSIGGVYGTTNALVVLDESWDVQTSEVTEGVRPTLLAAEGSLWLVSTAHRKATSLMLNERERAFDQMLEPRSRLILEWSARADRALDDREGWREASPHWSDYREELIADALATAESGEVLDPTEPDPIAGFSTQYLNRWPIRQTKRGAGAPLFEPGYWARALTTTELPIYQRCAVIEDNYGNGCSIAVAGVTAEERIAVTGELHEDRVEAFARLAQIAPTVEVVQISALLCHDPLVASVNTITELFGPTEVRRGLGTLRDLASRGELRHDGSPDLAGQALEARLRNGTSGLAFASKGRHDLVRAMAASVARVQHARALGAVSTVL